jgi:hypothetical protein
MLRARDLAIAIVLLAACTTHAEWEPEPIVTRLFGGSCPVERKRRAEFSSAIEAHGIECLGAEGAIMGSYDAPIDSWHGRCRGTEQQWRQAEQAIARLKAEGILYESYPDK